MRPSDRRKNRDRIIAMAVLAGCEPFERNHTEFPWVAIVYDHVMPDQTALDYWCVAKTRVGACAEWMKMKGYGDLLPFTAAVIAPETGASS